MSKIETRKRTFRCTDEEWEMIIAKAKESDLSTNQFLIDSAIKYDKEDSLEHNIKMIRKGVRFLAALKEEEYKMDGREEFYENLLDAME